MAVGLQLFHFIAAFKQVASVSVRLLLYRVTLNGIGKIHLPESIIIQWAAEQGVQLFVLTTVIWCLRNPILRGVSRIHYWKTFAGNYPLRFGAVLLLAILMINLSAGLSVALFERIIPATYATRFPIGLTRDTTLYAILLPLIIVWVIWRQQSLKGCPRISQ